MDGKVEVKRTGHLESAVDFFLLLPHERWDRYSLLSHFLVTSMEGLEEAERSCDTRLGGS